MSSRPGVGVGEAMGARRQGGVRVWVWVDIGVGFGAVIVGGLVRRGKTLRLAAPSYIGRCFE